MNPAEREADRLGTPRWRGQRGRIEVWYATATCAEGTGYWIHHETVSPTGYEGPYADGWVAVFDPEDPPRLARFERCPVTAAGPKSWFQAGDVQVGPGRLRGSAGTISWDLAFSDTTRPLYTFPKAAWEHELLPGTQVVPWPQAHFVGTVTLDGKDRTVDATGAMARIYGHANPQRWCWAHAQLDSETVIEVVSAVARRPGLRRLPPATMLRLRTADEADWPNSALAGVWRLRTSIRADGFSVTGRVGHRHLTLDVRLPARQSVNVAYSDPDGSTATCTNSERADLELTVSDAGGPIRRWRLTGRAHAETGTRP